MSFEIVVSRSIRIGFEQTWSQILSLIVLYEIKKIDNFVALFCGQSNVCSFLWDTRFALSIIIQK